MSRRGSVAEVLNKHGLSHSEQTDTDISEFIQGSDTQILLHSV